MDIQKIIVELKNEFLTWCEEYGVPRLGDVQPLHMPLA
jgi:hypothetical protein